MKPKGLEIRMVYSGCEKLLLSFFQEIKETGDDKFFHPHLFTEEQIDRIVNHCGKDLYYVMIDGGAIIGYAMLRGWEEGYEIPSLSIIIDKACRENGFGKLFMSFLHSAAKRKGAKKIRLKVHKDNTHTYFFYRNMGYIFKSEEEGQLVGFKYV